MSRSSRNRAAGGRRRARWEGLARSPRDFVANASPGVASVESGGPGQDVERHATISSTPRQLAGCRIQGRALIGLPGIQGNPRKDVRAASTRDGMSRTVHSEPDRTPSLGSLDAVGAVPQSSGDLPDGAHSVHLASRARDGDREALNSLLSLHEGWLRRVAGVLLGARVRRKLDSMDVVQEVSLLAIERIATLRTTDPASVRRWLTTILERRVKDMVQGLLADRRDVRREAPM